MRGEGKLGPVIGWRGVVLIISGKPPARPGVNVAPNGAFVKNESAAFGGGADTSSAPRTGAIGFIRSCVRSVRKLIGSEGPDGAAPGLPCGPLMKSRKLSRRACWSRSGGGVELPFRN